MIKNETLLPSINEQGKKAMIYVAFFITSIIYSFAHQLGRLAELFSSIFNHLFLLKTLLEQNALISCAVVPGFHENWFKYN